MAGIPGNDKFCLKWNDFEKNVSTSFQQLRDERDFFDVTLACEENSVTAHKIVLSAASEFFKAILRKHKHEHPLIYLTEVKFRDLQSILDFVYTGETEVAEKDLESLLATANRFKVKGLTDSSGSTMDGAESIKRKLKSEVMAEEKRSKVIASGPQMKTTITPVYHEAAVIKSEVDSDNHLAVRGSEPIDISR